MRCSWTVHWTRGLHVSPWLMVFPSPHHRDIRTEVALSILTLIYYIARAVASSVRYYTYMGIHVGVTRMREFHLMRRFPEQKNLFFRGEKCFSVWENMFSFKRWRFREFNTLQAGSGFFLAKLVWSLVRSVLYLDLFAKDNFQSII